jgi:hypothetical protein
VIQTVRIGYNSLSFVVDCCLKTQFWVSKFAGVNYKLVFVVFRNELLSPSSMKKKKKNLNNPCSFISYYQLTLTLLINLVKYHQFNILFFKNVYILPNLPTHKILFPHQKGEKLLIIHRKTTINNTTIIK